MENSGFQKATALQYEPPKNNISDFQHSDLPYREPMYAR